MNSEELRGAEPGFETTSSAGETEVKPLGYHGYSPKYLICKKTYRQFINDAVSTLYYTGTVGGMDLA